MRRPSRPLVAAAVGTIALAVVGASALISALRAEAAGVRSPVTNAPLAVGPVMVLGGGAERVAAALALDAVAVEGRELIASAGAAVDLIEEFGGDCDAAGVRCVAPDPFTTRGEARLAAALAAAKDWPGLTVVTSDWHAQRARRHFRACLAPLGVPVAVVAVPEVPADALPRRLVWREALGGLDARLRPECR